MNYIKPSGNSISFSFYGPEQLHSPPLVIGFFSDRDRPPISGAARKSNFFILMGA